MGAVGRGVWSGGIMHGGSREGGVVRAYNAWGLQRLLHQSDKSLILQLKKIVLQKKSVFGLYLISKT